MAYTEAILTLARNPCTAQNQDVIFCMDAVEQTQSMQRFRTVHGDREK